MSGVVGCCPLQAFLAVNTDEEAVSTLNAMSVSDRLNSHDVAHHSLGVSATLLNTYVVILLYIHSSIRLKVTNHLRNWYGRYRLHSSPACSHSALGYDYIA